MLDSHYVVLSGSLLHLVLSCIVPGTCLIHTMWYCREVYSISSCLVSYLAHVRFTLCGTVGKSTPSRLVLYRTWYMSGSHYVVLSGSLLHLVLSCIVPGTSQIHTMWYCRKIYSVLSCIVPGTCQIHTKWYCRDVYSSRLVLYRT